MSTSSCPKCQGPRDRGALYCAFCGVVFDKYIGGPTPPPFPAPGFAPVAAGVARPAAAAAFPFGVPSASTESYTLASIAPTPVQTEDAIGWQPGQKVRFTARDATVRQVDARAESAGRQAPRGRRLLARLVDLAAFAATVFCSVSFALSVVRIFDVSEADARILAGLSMLVGMFWLLATNLRLLYNDGQTLGKRAMGIRIVDVDGGRAPMTRLILLRWLPFFLVGLIPYLGMLVSLVNVCWIFEKEQRCLHDLLARTKVEYVY